MNSVLAFSCTLLNPSNDQRLVQKDYKSIKLLKDMSGIVDFPPGKKYVILQPFLVSRSETSIDLLHT